MNIPTISYLNEQGELAPHCKHVIDDEILLKGYKTMALTRHIEERMITLQRQGIITFAMSSKGEEASIIASAAALEISDWMYPQYRETGIAFWRDMPLSLYINNMFCNALDPIKGRQMPCHFGLRELNIVTASSPIGTKIPHAAGAAYGMKISNEKSCTISYFGDGASSEGDFYAGLNFAAVLKAPVIFFCRNNGYAISTPTSKQYASDGIAPKSIGLGIETFRVDGNDFFAIHETVAKAREHCLEGKGPVFIEAMTYRLDPHSTSDDPTKYRSDDEVLEWVKKCPILRLKLFLENKKLWNAEKEIELMENIKKEVDIAIKVAKLVPPPPLKSLFEDVLEQMPQNLRQEYEEIKQFFPGADNDG